MDSDVFQSDSSGNHSEDDEINKIVKLKMKLEIEG
jgi:hypothetical protein